MHNNQGEIHINKVKVDLYFSVDNFECFDHLFIK